MPYVYQTLTTKPAGAKWYPEVEPVKHASYNTWFESHPLIVKINNRRLTENEHLRVVQFASEEDFNTFCSERNERADYIERQHFLEANGFTVDIQHLKT